MLAVVITAASVQDRDGARPLLWNLSRCCTRIRLAWADAGYSGKLAVWADGLKIKLEIVRKRDAHAFEVLPRRWVVERTLAWITAHRRCARDYERLPEHAADGIRSTRHQGNPEFLQQPVLKPRP